MRIAYKKDLHDTLYIIDKTFNFKNVFTYHPYQQHPLIDRLLSEKKNSIPLSLIDKDCETHISHEEDSFFRTRVPSFYAENWELMGFESIAQKRV